MQERAVKLTLSSILQFNCDIVEDVLQWAMFGGMPPGGARREYRAPEPKHLIRLTFLRLGDVFALAMGAMNRFHKPASSVTMMFSIEYHRALLYGVRRGSKLVRTSTCSKNMLLLNTRHARMRPDGS